MNIIELYELEYTKEREVDSIPVLLNIPKKTFNYFRYLGSYNKKEKVTLTIDQILVDNIHVLKLEEENDILWFTKWRISRWVSGGIYIWRK